ncbi:hypothetical protein AB0H43_03170 [Hamadaea sp. NPDC050747]|uniref:hypothetical protein n=1 Tax=Hamadaea sp. NPDC050747 TaxID=3155789 RepID=UPI0033C1636C
MPTLSIGVPMNRPRAGLLALLAPLALAPACGSEEAPTAASPAPAASSPAPGVVTVVTSGFGQEDEYAWITAVVRNDGGAEGHFVVVQFNVTDASGKLIASESQTEGFSKAGETLAIGTQITVPDGAKVAKVEATVVVESTTTDAKPFAGVKVGPVAIKSTSGTYKASFTAENPATEPLQDARVGFVCFDAGGKVIGGASEFPDAIPASGKALVTGDLIVSTKPVRCDAYVGAPV